MYYKQFVYKKRSLTRIYHVLLHLHLHNIIFEFDAIFQTHVHCKSIQGASTEKHWLSVPTLLGQIDRACQLVLLAPK